MKHITSKTKKRFLIIPAVLVFAIVSVYGFSIFTGNKQQSNIGSSKASAQEPADFNNDNVVNVFDLSYLLGKWNTNDTTADLNTDGTVNVFDLSRLLSKWGVANNGNGTGSWWSGQSDTSTTQDGSFAAWRGRTVEIAGTWASIDNTNDAIYSPTWFLEPGYAYADIPRMDYAIGAMLKNTNDNWSAAANGANDSRWAQQLQQLKVSWGSRSASNMYIRFAHEFNGNWYPWTVTPDNIANFKNAWVRFANLRNQYFPGAKLVWCPNAGSSYSYDIRMLYPGNSYVDVIAVDKYNNYPWVNDQNSFNSELNRMANSGGPLGLESYRQYALQQGKPFAISEWSNDGNPTGDGTEGGGDSPNYMQYLHNWLIANGSQTPTAGKVLYEVLFNVQGYSSSYYSLYPLSLEPGNTEAANKYADLW